MAPSEPKVWSIRREGARAEEVDSDEFDYNEDFEDSEQIESEGESEEIDSKEDSEEIDLTVCSPVHAKLVRQSENGRLFSGTQLNEGIWGLLNEHLQEKIIARLPVKSLFRASSLSKTWRQRFRSDSFRREVQSSTASGKSYTPLLVSHDGELVGYESSSKRWHRLPTMSYLQQYSDWFLKAGDGPILCFLTPTTSLCHVHVTNPLTMGWKQLPPRPNMHFPELVHVGWEGVNAYKVILGDRIGGCLSLQIFDSSDGSWTLASCNGGMDFVIDWLGGVFSKGIVYILLTVIERIIELKLISFDVKERVWSESRHLYQALEEDQKPFRQMSFSCSHGEQMIVCRSHVMLVVIHSDFMALVSRTVSVFRLDVERGLAFEVSTAPGEMSCLHSFCTAAGHDDCIYVGCHSSCSTICYNVGTQEWHRVNSATDVLRSSGNTDDLRWLWSSVTYRPGLDPLVEV